MPSPIRTQILPVPYFDAVLPVRLIMASDAGLHFPWRQLLHLLSGVFSSEPLIPTAVPVFLTAFNGFCFSNTSPESRGQIRSKGKYTAVAFALVIPTLSLLLFPS